MEGKIWNHKLSAEEIRKWKERLLILVLSGVLLLVILLPVDKKGRGSQDVRDVKGKLTYDIQKDENTGIDNIRIAAEGNGSGTLMEADGYVQTYVQTLERRLAKTLSYIDGVGAVKVMITLQDGGEAIVEKDMPSTRNITTENDGDGGMRNVNEYRGEEMTIYHTGSDGSQTPYVVNRREPEIGGIVVVAQGGGNKKTAAEITGAIEALFDVEPHKIKVVRMTTLEK